ncbi:hypothetical protein SAMN05421770_103370 [Granulicella rosea]|uniref:Integron cassette protein VCH-CASS1 chain domain-containing protein n=2 Tax=Granulicella rosea TaxID=474952 RepID=A0A239J359_9BACT|nr:hypothetical protein SAMN05421770_103370 [Granulicella rosea]
MPLPVTDVTLLKAYLAGVMQRADHHANEVEMIALALTGAIIWKKDADRDIEVMQQQGETKNVLWVYIHGSRYAFSYNHAAKAIEMREGTTRGAILHSFSNGTTLSDLHAVFALL